MKIVMAYLLIALTASVCAHPAELRHWEIASRDPDRIYLTFNGDPATARAVSWRTSAEIITAYAEIAPALGAPGFELAAHRIEANTEAIDLNQVKNNTQGTVHFHSVCFTNLQPNTLYAYRVGDGERHWSEWIQFRTATTEFTPFSFLYFGDAQNDILSRWSRTIRMAQQTAPNAAFMLHCGDLVDHAHDDNEWSQWFKAGGFLHAQITGIPVLGNHEYVGSFLALGEKTKSILWRPQFNLPVETSLPKKLYETCYTVDYQGARVIVLNSNQHQQEQTAWFEAQLKRPGARWLIVAFHHPLFPPAGRAYFNDELRTDWLDLIKRYNVDLLLQGHDHSYLRGRLPQLDQPEQFQTLVVTSVSGPKQYRSTAAQVERFAAEGFIDDRRGQNGQFFQHIQIEDDTLTYRSYLANGELYDEAHIYKNHETGKKTLSTAAEMPRERSFKNTIEYSKANL
jgi:3',5'-cyclic AMP phosphodiesterase CpdA